MSDDLASLAYEAALRSLDKQEQVLSEVRARTGTLVAVSALAASFLGRPVGDHPHATAVLLIAVIAFATSVAPGLYVVVPKRDLIVSLSGVAVYEGLFEFGDDMEEVRRRLAYELTYYRDENTRILGKLFGALRVATVALAVEILCLVAVVTGTLA